MLVFERPHTAPKEEGQVVVDQAVVNNLAVALMDQIECGLIACSGGGRLLHANRAARRELAKGNVLKIADNALRCAPGSQAELTKALQDAAVRQLSRLLWLGDADDCLTLVAMPIRVEGFGVPTALLMLGRRNLCSPLGLEMLASRHGLTLAERRVLKALIADQSAREIAASHCVGLATVRTQIQSIRNKVGVRSIDALLLRAAQVPPVTSWQEFHHAA